MLIFFAGFAVFVAKWYFEGDTHRKENKQLRNEINTIQLERDSLAKARTQIDERYKKLESELIDSKSKIASLDRKLQQNRRELVDAENELDRLNRSIAESRGKIEGLKANPIKRTGGDLIESIKEKTK